MSDEIKTTDTMISIHALREEGDTRIRRWRTGWRLFLSTPSARRATIISLSCGCDNIDISIHALREEGDVVRLRFRRCVVEFLSTPSARRATLSRTGSSGMTKISIHALREEGDASRRRGRR